MLTIRLKPMAGKGKSFYRIVATDKKRKLTAPALDTLGFWQPSKNKVVIDKEKLKIWRGKGAFVTQAVEKLLGK